MEVLSALRRLVASGEATAERAGEAIADLLDLPIERYPHDILVPRIWELRENFSAYDASYVALAEAVADEPVPLLTADARLARAIDEHCRRARPARGLTPSAARERSLTSMRPKSGPRALPTPRQHPRAQEKPLFPAALREPSAGLEPATPSLPWKCSTN